MKHYQKKFDNENKNLKEKVEVLNEKITSLEGKDIVPVNGCWKVCA